MAGIGDWSEARLRQFIKNLVRSDPPSLPSAMTLRSITATEKLSVLGSFELSPQAERQTLGARGSGTMLAAATTAIVTHGLGRTPSQVLFAHTANPGTATWWVSAKAADTFTLTSPAAVGANKTFDWIALP